MSIRLAFSGGGFRATLFHLGVVRYLRQRGFLSDVKAICSVSGGSILAAHLVLHWDKYTGSPVDWDKITKQLIDFVRYDVRGRIVRTWILCWTLAIVLWLAPPSLFLYFLLGRNNVAAALLAPIWFGMGMAVIGLCKHSWSLIRGLERQYSNLLYRCQKDVEVSIGPGDAARKDGKSSTEEVAKLKNLGDKAGAPSLHILATNLTTGQMCSFDEIAFHVFSAGKDGYTDTPHRLPNLPLGRAVAASSAFPVLFSPVILTNDDFGGAPEFSRPQRLADGGIFENLGLAGLTALFSSQHWPHDCTLMLSDGQAVFNPEVSIGFHLLPSRANRTIDIVMHRVTLWQLAEAAKAVASQIHASTHESGKTPMRQASAEAAKAVQLETLAEAIQDAAPIAPTEAAQRVASPTPAAVQLVAAATAAGGFRHISLTQSIKGRYTLDENQQKRLARTRTDMDTFSDAEIQLLIYQGFCAAKANYEGDNEEGTHPVPPTGAYTDGWNPTAVLPEKVVNRLTDDPNRVLGPRSRLASLVRELFAPANWGTLFLVVVLIGTFYPVFTGWTYPVLHSEFTYWVRRPDKLPLQYVEDGSGTEYITARTNQPWLPAIWKSLQPADRLGMKSVLLRSAMISDTLGERPMHPCKVTLRCVRPGDTFNGNVFLVRGGEGQTVWQHLIHTNNFVDSLEVTLPATERVAVLVGVLVLKKDGRAEFPTDLKTLFAMEVSYE